jgi:hypothetical protein
MFLQKRPQEQKPQPKQKALVATTVSLALITGGAIGWVAFQDQKNAQVDLSRATLSEVCQRNTFPDKRSLDVSRQRFNAATRNLLSIPNLPGLHHQQAHDLVANHAPCQQKLEAESDFLEAQALHQSGIDLVNNQSSLSVQDWEKALLEVDRAIGSLAEIPSTSVRYDQAQAQIGQYKGEYETFSQNLKIERSASENFRQAEALYQLAENVSAPLASSHLSEAIGLLRSIPDEGTTVSLAAKENLSTYTNRLSEIRSQAIFDTLQSFLGEFDAFAVEADLDNYQGYQARVGDLQRQLDALQAQYPESINYFALLALQDALNHYKFALEVWQYCGINICSRTTFTSHLFIPIDSPIGTRLRDNYGLELILFYRGIDQDDAIDVIQQRARQDIERARSYLE